MQENKIPPLNQENKLFIPTTSEDEIIKAFDNLQFTSFYSDVPSGEASEAVSHLWKSNKAEINY